MSHAPPRGRSEGLLGRFLPVLIGVLTACGPAGSSGPGGVSATDAARVAELVETGLRLAREGDPAAGIDAFERAYAIDPTHPEVTLTLAAAHRENQRLARSIEVASSGLSAHPGDVELRLARARAREMMADYAGAEEDYRHVATADGSADGTDPRAHIRLGAVLAAQNRPVEALAAIARAGPAGNTSPEALLVTGSSHLALGQLGPAETSLRGCLAQRPDWVEPRYKLSTVLQRRGAGREAGRERERAARLSRLALEIERLEGEAEEFMRGREGKKLERHEILGVGEPMARAYLEAFRFEEAERNIRSTLRLLPDEGVLLYLLTLAVLGQGKVDAAIAIVDGGQGDRPPSEEMARARRVAEDVKAEGADAPIAMQVEGLLGVTPR